MQEPFVVGITGGSASGKTHFLKSLLSYFTEEELCLISQDNYYKPLEQQTLDDNGVHNFDTPETIDFDAFFTDIQNLKRGIEVLKKEYTFNNPSAPEKYLQLKPAPIILVEGIYVFYNPHIYNLLDLKIFIDAKEHIKLKRRIVRDNYERGYDLEDVLYRYENHVAPSYEKHIEPFKYDADIIISNNKSFDKALEVLVVYLKNKIKN